MKRFVTKGDRKWAAAQLRGAVTAAMSADPQVPEGGFRRACLQLALSAIDAGASFENGAAGVCCKEWNWRRRVRRLCAVQEIFLAGTLGLALHLHPTVEAPLPAYAKSWSEMNPQGVQGPFSERPIAGLDCQAGNLCNGAGLLLFHALEAIRGALPGPVARRVVLSSQGACYVSRLWWPGVAEKHERRIEGISEMGVMEPLLWIQAGEIGPDFPVTAGALDSIARATLKLEEAGDPYLHFGQLLDVRIKPYDGWAHVLSRSAPVRF